MKQIIFIRHGEKTKKDPINLSNKGFERARELVSFFINNTNYELLKTPDKIIAMKQAHKKSSNRPYQTVTPLAEYLSINIFSPFKRDQIEELVDYIKNMEFNCLLICWEHSCIPKIVSRLLNTNHELIWGLNPESKEISNNYSAVWILKDNIIS